MSVIVIQMKVSVNMKKILQKVPSAAFAKSGSQMTSEISTMLSLLNGQSARSVDTGLILNIVQMWLL